MARIAPHPHPHGRRGNAIFQTWGASPWLAVPPESVVELEGALRVGGQPVGPPASSAAPATSAITQERAGSGPLTLAFLAVSLLLAVGAGAAAWILGVRGAETVAETYAEPLVFGLADQGLAFGRAVSAIATATTVLGIAFAGRSLTRSGIAGLLAAAVVAADPALLVYGRLALPTALTLAFLAVSLACFAASRSWVPWFGGLALALGALVDPRVLLWGPVLAVFTLLRGHIYASPRHLGIALVQALAIPAVGAAIHVAAQQGWAAVPICLAPGTVQMLTLHAAIQPGANLLAQPNPVTWVVGLGAVLFLGLGGAGFGAMRFRLARANGRMQARLVAPFPPVFGRGIWLLLLALVVPIPQAWLLLAALALALGIQDLGEDAPGFGLALAIALLAFAAVVLWRSWDAVAGTGGATGVEDALNLVPWAQSAPC